jgi:hypothetical protein
MTNTKVNLEIVREKPDNALMPGCQSNERLR